jgi:hypothetical protein
LASSIGNVRGGYWSAYMTKETPCCD